MVSSQVVIETVKRMANSGIDDATIRMTLKGIDLSDKEIDDILSSVKTGKMPMPQSDPAEEEPQEDEGEDIEDGEEEAPHGEISREINAVSQEQQALHTTTHQILEEHGDKLGEVHRAVGEINEKVSTPPQFSADAIARISALDNRISSLEKEISETKANTIALQQLLSRVLEANREIILELQKKK